MAVHALQPEVSEYVRNKLLHVKKMKMLTVAQLAKIAGYQRVSMQNVLSGEANIGLANLYNLSQHFGLPMDYWFPPCEEVVDRLLVPHKRQLIILAQKYADMLPCLVSLAITLSLVDEASRQKVVSVVKTFVTQMRRPAP